MRVTGWTVPELRAAPASVVRAHFLRIFVGLVWNPELAQVAARPAPQRSSYGSLADYAAARKAQTETRAAVKTLEAALWPEDTDG